MAATLVAALPMLVLFGCFARRIVNSIGFTRDQMTHDTLRLAGRTPPREWAEAVPLGNGRIGAMVFGGASARLQVNDATVWSGTPDGPDRALDTVVAGGAGPARLAEVRTAIDAGDLRAAERDLLSFEGPYSQEFLPFVDLHLTLVRDPAGAEAAARELDLDEASCDRAVRRRRRTHRAPHLRLRPRAGASSSSGSRTVRCSTSTSACRPRCAKRAAAPRPTASPSRSRRRSTGRRCTSATSGAPLCGL